MTNHKLSRRQFIGQASCAALGSTTMLSTLANLMTSNKLLATQNTTTNDYKALVCILLAGGNDSFNMLLPYGQDEYAEYAVTRSNLAIPREEILPLIPENNIGKSLGLHPTMFGLQNLFEEGNAAMVANVGTLIEPIQDYAEFDTRLKKIPLGLYSHSDQIQQWQTAAPHSRQAVGWGGKIADILRTQNTNQGISMNISLSGRNVFQTGNSVVEYAISNRGNGVEGIKTMHPWNGNSGLLNRIRQDAINDMTTQMYSNVFKDNFSEMAHESIDAIGTFEKAINQSTPFNTVFADHYLAQNLRMVAKTIAAKDKLGVNRQTFFVTFGGWDHHDEVLNNQNFMLGMVSTAISQFFQALEEVGLKDNVTLFTISDFARTLTSNGNGSDHAWGGNAIVAGGAVNGKRIFGDYPDLYIKDNPLMISRRGNLIPTTAADLYFAELALWFGVSPNDLGLIFPNLHNFYSASSNKMPLGFLNL